MRVPLGDWPAVAEPWPDAVARADLAYLRAVAWGRVRALLAQAEGT